MKKVLFAIGSAVALLSLIACGQAIDSVGINAGRAGSPGNVSITVSPDENWAIVSWTAGANASQHEIVKRQDGSNNHIVVNPRAQRHGGTFSWNGYVYEFTAGTNVDQYSAVISLFGIAGDFSVGVRSLPFDSVSGMLAHSYVTWHESVTAFRAFVPVENVTFPQAITGTVGTEIDLNALVTITPATATFQDIDWTVQVWAPSVNTWVTLEDASNGIFTPPFAGAFRVNQASIWQGVGSMSRVASNFTLQSDISIVVTGESFVPATVSFGQDMPFNATAGQQIDLNEFVNVTPANATNRTVTSWELDLQQLGEWGSTWVTIPADITNGTLTLPSLGETATVRVRAIVENGRFWTGSAWDSNANATFSIFVTDPNFVPVTAITIPPNVNFQVGVEIDLNEIATVTPANASNQVINWSVLDQNTWTMLQITDGIWTPQITGSTQLTATIPNGGAGGSNVQRQFNVQVQAPQLPPNFVQVTDVILPTSIQPGTQINLNTHASVIPQNATNRTDINWDVQVMDGVGSWYTIQVASGIFPLPAHVTRLNVRANVVDGNGPGQDFQSNWREIWIVPAGFVPVTAINGIPTSVTAGAAINLNTAATVMPANATNRTIQWDYSTTGQWGQFTSIANPASWTPPAVSSFHLRATVLDGNAPGNHFANTANVSTMTGAGFTAVTNVTFESSQVTIAAGGQVNLNTGVTIAPANATFSAMRWDNIQISVRRSDTGETRWISITAPDGVFPMPQVQQWESVVSIGADLNIPNAYGIGSHHTEWRTIIVVPSSFTAVTSVTITGLPTSNTAGSPVNLNAATVTVLPANATNQNVIWEVSGWGNFPGGVWTPTWSGSFSVRARVINGTLPGQDFFSEWETITVDPAPLPEGFVPVTGIDFPATISGIWPGGWINLNNFATVQPGNATNQTIQWGSQGGVEFFNVNEGWSTWESFSIGSDGGVWLPNLGSEWVIIGLEIPPATIPNGSAPGTSFSTGWRWVNVQ